MAARRRIETVLIPFPKGNVMHLPSPGWALTVLLIALVAIKLANSVPAIGNLTR